MSMMSEDQQPPEVDVDVEARSAPLTAAAESNARDQDHHQDQDQVMADNPSSGQEIEKSLENNTTTNNVEGEDEPMEDGGVRLENAKNRRHTDESEVVVLDDSDREVQMVNGTHSALDNPQVNGIINNISSQVNGITNGFTTPPKNSKAGQVNGQVNGVNGVHAADHHVPSESTSGRGNTQSPSKRRLQPPNPKTQKEILRLTEVLRDVSQEAAQRFFREQWRAVLFEPWNEDYLTFILRAGLKNCSTTVIDRLFKDSGVFKDSLIVASSNHPEVRRLVMSDIILDELPEEALDEALAKRVKDVPATTLVKWLAEAGRLGYRPDDLIDLETESVTPNIGNMNISESFTPASQITSQAQQIYEGQKIEQQKQREALAEQQLMQQQYESRQDPLLLEQERNLEAARLAGNAPVPKLRKESSNLNRKQKVLPPVAMPVPPPINGAMVCPFCHRMLATLSGYNFHVSKKVCMQELPIGKFFSDYCDNCQKGFVGKQGLLYHTKKNVCRGDDFATVAGPAYIAPAPAPLSYAPSPVPSHITPHVPAHVPSNASSHAHTPSHGHSPSNSPTNQLQQEAAANSPTPPSSLPPVRQMYSFAPKPVSTPVASERPYKPRVSGGLSSTSQFQTPSSAQSSRPLTGDVPGRFIGPGDLPADKLLEMNSRIDAAEQKYNAQLASITHLQGEALEKKIASLKQGTASKKSMIRKEYGVTVRQKKLKPEDSDMSTPVNNKLKLEGSRAPSSAPGPTTKKQRMPAAASMHQSSPAVPLASSFSPINAPRPPTAPPGYMTVAHYPGQNLTMRANSYGQIAPPPPQQGFDARHQLITAESYAQTNKRRRTEGFERDSPVAPRPSDLGMVEVRSEDAADVMAAQKEQATKDKKKVPVRDAQAKWEALHGKVKPGTVGSAEPGLETDEAEADTPMADAPASEETSEQNNVVDIITDDEEETAQKVPASAEEVAAQDEVIPSVEATSGETMDETRDTTTTEPEPEVVAQADTEPVPPPSPAPAPAPAPAAVPLRGSLRVKRGTKKY